MRKVIDITINDEGRDFGRVYRITEMGARQAEKWATRALLAMGRSGAEIPDDLRGSGMAGIAAFGIKSLMTVDFADAEPLMDELLWCVTFRPDPKNPGFARELLEDDIEEVATLLKLRSEVLSLHVSFSQLVTKLKAYLTAVVASCLTTSTSRD